MRNLPHSGPILISYHQVSSWFMCTPAFPIWFAFLCPWQSQPSLLDVMRFPRNWHTRSWWCLQGFLPARTHPFCLRSPRWFWLYCFIWLLTVFSCWAAIHFIQASVWIVTNYELMEFKLSIFVPYVNTWERILCLNPLALSSFLLSISNYFLFLLIFFL